MSHIKGFSRADVLELVSYTMTLRVCPLIGKWLAPDIGGAIATFDDLGVQGSGAGAAEQERLFSGAAAQAVAIAVSTAQLHGTLPP